MKTSLSVIGAILLLTVSALTQGALPNFSGTWVLDAAKSDFGSLFPGSELRRSAGCGRTLILSKAAGQRIAACTKA